MTLRLNGLEATCIIGDLDWERAREQTLLIDLALELDDSVADADTLSETVDYVALANDVRRALKEARCRMIEHAAKVVCTCALESSLVCAAEASVTKRVPVAGLASATAVLRRTQPGVV